jgi:hypothetical protein
MKKRWTTYLALVAGLALLCLGIGYLSTAQAQGTSPSGVLYRDLHQHHLHRHPRKDAADLVGDLQEVERRHAADLAQV